MAKDITDKCFISSPYSPGHFVTPMQFIIELVCEKKAKLQKRDLNVQFWNQPEWAAYYKQQLRMAATLLKKYDWKAISRALKHKKAWNIYSLRAPHLIPLIETEDKLVKAEAEALKAKQEKITQEVDYSFLPAGRTVKFNKTPMSALMELDDIDG